MLDGKIFCTGQSSKAVFETPEYPGCNAYNRDGVGVGCFVGSTKRNIHNFKDGLSLSWKTPKTYMIHSWKMVVFVSLKHPFKIWLLRVPALLVSSFLGQVRCLNGKGKVPNKNDDGNKKPQWEFPTKFPNENSQMKWNHFQQKQFFLGKHNHVFGDSFEMRCSLDPRNWAAEMRRHLRRGKFKAQQFIFAIKAATLGREGAAPKKKALQLGKYGGKGDCVLGVSVGNLGSWLLLRNCQFFLIRLGRDRNQLKPQITSRSKLLLPAHQA